MTACQRAVDGEFDSGVVYILPGNYEFTKTVEIPSNCCVIGNQTTRVGAPDTIFHFSDSPSYKDNQGCLLREGSRLKNVCIEIDGQRPFYAISTVDSDIIIEHCYFRKFASLVCYASCTIDKCSFEENTDEYPSIDFGVPTGFIPSGGGEVTISECNFLGQLFPVRISGVQHPIGEEGYNVTIINSRFAGVTEYKRVVNGGWGDPHPSMSIPYFYGNRALQYETPTEGALPSTIPEKYLNKSGGTMTGPLVLSSDPTKNLEAATKQYVDNHTVSAMVYEDGLPEKPSTPIADGQEIPYTWEQINDITLAGKAQEYFSLGATKLVNLSTAVLGANAATMMVIGFNQDGKNTTTFQTKGVLPTTTAFGSSAIWIDSTVRTQCQVFYNACEAKSFIKTVSKGTCPKQVADKNGTATYNNETVWIPSETEMGLDNHSSLTKSNSTTSNSECTKGYNAGYSYYTSYTTRVKYQMNANGSLTTTAASYWERSRYYGRTTNACIVYNDGKPANTSYTGSYGFAPAFVIGNSTLSAKITQDGEDITDKVKELITSDSQNPVFLKRITTSADAASISIDVSDINFDDYYEVVMYTNLVDPTNQYAGSTPMCKIRINNVSRSEYGFSNGTNANGEIGQFQYIYSGALLNTKRFTSSPCKVYIQKKDSAIFVYGSYTYIIWSGDRTWNHATEIYGEFELETSEAFSSLQIIAEDGKSTIRTGSTIEFWGYKK